MDSRPVLKDETWWWLKTTTNRWGHLSALTLRHIDAIGNIKGDIVLELCVVFLVSSLTIPLQSMEKESNGVMITHTQHWQNQGETDPAPLVSFDFLSTTGGGFHVFASFFTFSLSFCHNSPCQYPHEISSSSTSYCPDEDIYQKYLMWYSRWRKVGRLNNR